MGWPHSAERSLTVPVKITAVVGVMWGPNGMDKDGSCFTYMSCASDGIARTAGFLEDFSVSLSLSLSPCGFLFGSFGLPYSMEVSWWLNYEPGFPRENIPKVPSGGCKVSYDLAWEVTPITFYPQNVSLRASSDSMGEDMHTGKLVDQFIDSLSLEIYSSRVRI